MTIIGALQVVRNFDAVSKIFEFVYHIWVYIFSSREFDRKNDPSPSEETFDLQNLRPTSISPIS